jgi:uncharacterized protein YyaL (SSP411 family)
VQRARSLASIAAALALALPLASCSSCTRDPSASSSASASALASAPVTSPELRARLREAARAKGPAYVPRTRHKDPDGAPTYTNRLVLESSPYLLQHAHNPVDWFPWGDEAFETARRLGRPVLLSIGYSTCHWCHVMEEESFEDDEIAQTINDKYIAIKVDREERPDVDAIYMSAVQSLTGGGGWPMTMWLTPERKPFFGGTYFPARDGDRGTRNGFLGTLKKLRIAYDEEPTRILASADKLAAGIREHLSEGSTSATGASASSAANLPSAETLDAAAAFYRSRFDATYGGMRGAPKFPSTLPTRFLLRDQRRRAGSPEGRESLRMATVTLERMSAGGMHDHVGGGFHRYSTDERWLVPHFEKMLYDNALLGMAYLEGWQVTHRADFADVVKDLLAYVARDMTSPDGAFYSATDADSLDPRGRREEGWFFTWTPAELEGVLGMQNARIVGAYYGVTKEGNLDGRSVLHASRAGADVARELGIGEDALHTALHDARAPLLAARARRPPPLRDEKVLTAWNGLMISAHARAALAFGDATYAARAERAADFLLRTLSNGRDGRLLRSYKDGIAKVDAYLDDHAFLIAALLDLHEATGRQRWLEEAVRLDGIVEAHFEDKAAGGFFLVADDHEKLLAREKPSYDGAEPSGSSVETLNLLRLYELTTREPYRVRAERAFAAIAPVVRASPASLNELLLAIDFATDVPKEIVIVTPHTVPADAGSAADQHSAADARSAAEPFLAKLRERYLPNRVLVVVSEGDALAALERIVPLVGGKTAQHGRATAYVCERRTCELPTTDPDVFAAQITRRR